MDNVNQSNKLHGRDQYFNGSIEPQLTVSEQRKPEIQHLIVVTCITGNIPNISLLAIGTIKKGRIQ